MEGTSTILPRSKPILLTKQQRERGDTESRQSFGSITFEWNRTRRAKYNLHTHTHTQLLRCRDLTAIKLQ